MEGILEDFRRLRYMVLKHEDEAHGRIAATEIARGIMTGSGGEEMMQRRVHGAVQKEILGIYNLERIWLLLSITRIIYTCPRHASSTVPYILHQMLEAPMIRLEDPKSTLGTQP
jgi:hypothetical protein